MTYCLKTSEPTIHQMCSILKPESRMCDGTGAEVCPRKSGHHCPKSIDGVQVLGTANPNISNYRKKVVDFSDLLNPPKPNSPKLDF